MSVPLAHLLHMRRTYEAWKLGREIGALLMEMTDARSQSGNSKKEDLLSRQVMTRREVVDECKTFFFGGHETTALALSWTLLMLAAHPEWQEALREELHMVAAGGEEGPLELGRLTKMGWVMSEVLRLYPPSPNVQRQAL